MKLLILAHYLKVNQILFCKNSCMGMEPIQCQNNSDKDGDSVIADKGFDITRDMPKNAALNIPLFLRDHSSLTIEEETGTRCIAAVCVHVKRAIRRIKVFRILKTIFSISMDANLNKMWTVCAYFTNFLPPLMQEYNFVN